MLCYALPVGALHCAVLCCGVPLMALWLERVLCLLMCIGGQLCSAMPRRSVA
jgi:hypothetical protein